MTSAARGPRSAIHGHLQVLVERIGARPPGSDANRRATAYVEEALAHAGLRVRRFPFETRWWEPGTGSLQVGGDVHEVTPNPYSPACDLDARVLRVSALAELESLAGTGQAPLAGRLLVLTGEPVREQIVPACFPFVSVDDHRRLMAAIHAARPAAIVAVSDDWQPIFEDPDLTIPSTTVPPSLGDRLVPNARVGLRLGGAVHAGSGATVSGRTSIAGPRIVVSAHLDSKATTPGAFDNAGGVAVLLALAGSARLRSLPVELVLFNGEDHADACGERAWLAGSDLSEILANVNVDGAGLIGRGTSLASLACPPQLERWLDGFVAARPGWVRAAPWYASDHAIFAMQGIPALAITTEDVHALLGGLAHGPNDTLEVVDPTVLADVLTTLTDLLPGLLHRLLDRPPPPEVPS